MRFFLNFFVENVLYPMHRAWRKLWCWKPCFRWDIRYPTLNVWESFALHIIIFFFFSWQFYFGILLPNPDGCASLQQASSGVFFADSLGESPDASPDASADVSVGASTCAPCEASSPAFSPRWWSRKTRHWSYWKKWARLMLLMKWVWSSNSWNLKSESIV